MFSLTSVLAAETVAERVRVAVASNFLQPMRSLEHAFEKQTEHEVSVSFGSSGKFYAQIMHGAPFDVFMSADQARPDALHSAGFTQPEARFTYALGGLALWSVHEGVAEDLEAALDSDAYRHLAMANPKLAPYGAAALEVLDNLGLTQSTQSRWVQGESISQVYQFVSSGNAEIGFVAQSQLVDKAGERRGTLWIIPGHLHNPIRQDVVLLQRAQNNQAALDFLKYLRGADAQKIIESYGYKIPLAQH